MRYTRWPPASLLDLMVSPRRFLRVPAKVPLTVCCLCRHRHKQHYADAKIMPTDVGNTSCVVGIVAMESA